jgi:hypothetical protein
MSQETGAEQLLTPPPPPAATPASSTGGPSPEAAPSVYDADVSQRVPVLIPFGDELFEAVLVCVPPTDEALINYAKQCAKANESDKVADPFAAQLDATSSALCQLFDLIVADLEGFEEGEEKPDGWRDIFGPADKMTILENAIFALTPVETPRAKGKRPSWKMQLQNFTTRFRVVFDGQEVTVSHTLKKADGKNFSAHARLVNRVMSAYKGGDANMPELAEVYDALHVAHEGYAGRVPLHHKAFAAITHLSRQARVTRKN